MRWWPARRPPRGPRRAAREPSGCAAIARSEPTPVRLGETTTSSLWVTNTSDRGARPAAGCVAAVGRRPRRGARPRRAAPRAGAAHDLPRAHPARRPGRRPGDGAFLGPLGLGARQRSLEVPGSVRAQHAFPSRKHLPSRLAVLRQFDGRAAVRTRGRARSSTACATTSRATTCARSTGAPPPGDSTSSCAPGSRSSTGGSSSCSTPPGPARGASATLPPGCRDGRRAAPHRARRVRPRPGAGHRR